MDKIAEEGSSKRRRTSQDDTDQNDADQGSKRSRLLIAPISPPRGRSPGASAEQRVSVSLPSKVIPSPVHLTTVKELPVSDNLDTVSLYDLIGDPLIKECWAFNYLFDIDFVLENLDEDVRDQIQLFVVHGSWKRESPSRHRIDQAASRHSNVHPIVAFMPEPFGTHHTKMIVLIKHDDTAQVIILTANMLRQDWRMCQTVWRSPDLPRCTSSAEDVDTAELDVAGSGARFKHDLLAYMLSYGNRLSSLIASLQDFDFAAVRGTLIASTPGLHQVDCDDFSSETLWGWPALRRALKRIHCATGGHIVVQISSVASLGVNDKWLKETLLGALRLSRNSNSRSNQSLQGATKPRLSIVFPTAEEIRRTIDGYGCGGSIHMKIENPSQRKQLDYMRPHLCHWAGDSALTHSLALAESSASGDAELVTQGGPVKRSAGRNRTGPHIKTYIRFTGSDMTELDWALITSANLSKQAWGTSSNERKTRVSSYELGILVWPQLWDEEREKAKLVPVFKRDTPDIIGCGSADTNSTTEIQRQGIHVGFRMPYDLPLVPYFAEEDPWCNTARHSTPDWRGGFWMGGNG